MEDMNYFKVRLDRKKNIQKLNYELSYKKY